MTVVERMDPLNDMCDALVSITDILRKRRQTNGNATRQSGCVEKCPSKEEEENPSTDLPSLKTTGTRHPDHNDRLHSEPLTEENFHRAHLLNRSIDELPSKAIHGRLTYRERNARKIRRVSISIVGQSEKRQMFEVIRNKAAATTTLERRISTRTEPKMGARDRLTSASPYLDISIRDVKHLKSIHVYTMQDLLGRFLVHDAPDEFRAFLVNTFQVSEKTASTITHLLQRWTRCNVDSNMAEDLTTDMD